MTQAITNNLNNLQELMTQANQLQSKTSEVKEVVATDKTSNKLVDFSKVYEKQVSKEKETTNITENKNINTSDIKTVADLKTIADLKNNNQIQQTETNWADFQAILSKITEESNAETSLDLTLARDIEEIISQLKEAIEETVDETEDTVEQSEVVEEITTETFNEDLPTEELRIIEEEENTTTENEKSTQNYTNNNKIAQELIAYSSKESTVLDSSNNIEEANVNFEENLINDFNSLENNFEALEFFNNLSADDSSNVNKTDNSSPNELENIIEEDILKELNVESIKAEVDASGDDSLLSSQTPQEQAVKAMLNSEVEIFDLKIDKTMPSQQVQTTQAKPIEISSNKIIEQITKQMESLQNNSKVNIVLNPEALGKVTIQLIKTGEGLSAQFTVANQEVRDLLMKGLEGLKETLTTHGVGVDNVSVKMNETQKSEYNADWTEQEGSRGGNKEERQSKDEKEKGLFEKMMAQTLKEENGNV